GRLDGEGLADPRDGAASPRRGGLGEHVQPLRSRVTLRRLQGIGFRERGRASRSRAVRRARWRMSRLPVRKTYKLFIGGAFPRSESGRTYEAEGQNVARASRKDVRDAVRAARAAQAKWAGATAYNRGQVLYRLAEMVQARAVELAEALATSDVPGGVVNILTGFRSELAPVLAAHADVNAIDLAGADGLASELERLAAENVKRVVHGESDTQSPWDVARFLELKTVWHPVGT